MAKKSDPQIGFRYNQFLSKFATDNHVRSKIFFYCSHDCFGDANCSITGRCELDEAEPYLQYIDLAQRVAGLLHFLLLLHHMIQYDRLAASGGFSNVDSDAERPFVVETRHIFAELFI